MDYLVVGIVAVGLFWFVRGMLLCVLFFAPFLSRFYYAHVARPLWRLFYWR